MATILVVDDDANIRELLRLYVEREGHRTLFAASGEAALELAMRTKPDIVLLDVMLPGMDGLEVCRRLRDVSDVPILLLTARSAEGDRVIGLDLGADDYVVKPFSPRELMARVRALLRRRRRGSDAADEPMLAADGLVLDPNAVVVELDGRRLDVTPNEFRILHALMRRPTRVLTRDELIDAVHGDDDPGVLDRTIDVHLGRLRRKLGDDAARPRFIATVRTVGYRFAAPVERVAPTPPA
ncbi:MAG TPA: response regulator transcription factor [Candidatus Limnocylindria bacterium]|nr:response regulator transcription factor [Candidatus Limnocylindria bacterium]